MFCQGCDILKKELSKNDIDSYLSEINERLRIIRKSGEITMVGGAVMAAIFNARNTTKDIDAYFQPSGEMRKIITDMSEEHQLEADWLNDSAKNFITDKMRREVYAEYSNLLVYNLDAESILALKLTSARNYSSDMSDSIVLMKRLKIKDIDELYSIVENHTNKALHTANSYFFVQEAFEKYQKALQKEEKGEKEDPLSISDWTRKMKKIEKPNKTSSAKAIDKTKKSEHER